MVVPRTCQEPLLVLLKSTLLWNSRKPSQVWLMGQFNLTVWGKVYALMGKPGTGTQVGHRVIVNEMGVVFYWDRELRNISIEQKCSSAVPVSLCWSYCDGAAHFKLHLSPLSLPVPGAARLVSENQQKTVPGNLIR